MSRGPRQLSGCDGNASTTQLPESGMLAPFNAFGQLDQREPPVSAVFGVLRQYRVTSRT